MPQRYSGVKELRKSAKKRLHNQDIKTDLKKTIKKLLTAVEAKNKTEASENLKTVYKKLDKASKRNILSKNTAARKKSRFSKLVLRLQ